MDNVRCLDKLGKKKKNTSTHLDIYGIECNGIENGTKPRIGEGALGSCGDIVPSVVLAEEKSHGDDVSLLAGPIRMRPNSSHECSVPCTRSPLYVQVDPGYGGIRSAPR